MRGITESSSFDALAFDSAQTRTDVTFGQQNVHEDRRGVARSTDIKFLNFPKSKTNGGLDETVDRRMSLPGNYGFTQKCFGSKDAQSTNKSNLESLVGPSTVDEDKKQLRASNSSSGFALIGKDELISGSRLELDALLSSKDMLRAFLRCLQAQHCAENLLFYLAADAFARVFDEERAEGLAVSVSRSSMLEQALEIHARFLKDDAPKWVCTTPDVLSAINTALEEMSSGSDNKLYSQIFAAAQEQSKQTLERDCIPRFVKGILERENHHITGFEVDKELRLAFVRILRDR